MARLNIPNKPVNTGNQDRTRVKVGANITITRAQQTLLLQHISERLVDGDHIRKLQIQQFEKIDREVAGWFKRDQADEERQKKNNAGEGLYPTDVKLPLVFSQIDEAVTFLLLVLAPSPVTYKAMATKDLQQATAGVASLMNEHAEYFCHERSLSMFFLNCMLYNFGAMSPEWKIVHGTKMVTQSGQRPSFERGEVYKGNEVHWLDPYNLFYDVSVPPTTIARDGEWFATVEILTDFRLRKKHAEGVIYLQDPKAESLGSGTVKWYEVRPDIRTDELGSTTGKTNWFDVLTGGMYSGPSQRGQEIVKFRGWIVPKNFGLSDVDAFELWEIWTMDGQYVIKAERKNNAHGLLPLCIGMPLEDGFLQQTPSYAERLVPYQTFASFQMNLHQRASRKALFGTTFYDANMFPQFGQENMDMAGGKIPANQVGNETDFRKRVLHFNDAPRTEGTMEDIGRMDDIMQKVLPTSMAQNVTDLQRATQFQAAAAVHGTNRRSLRIARIVDAQAFVPCRHIQVFNILEMQDTIKQFNEAGETTEVSPGQFGDVDIQFLISAGMRGMDQMTFQLHMERIINIILQNQQASQQFNVVDLINYFTSIIGDVTDFTQFKIESPIDQLPPEQKNLAFQLLQQFLASQTAQGDAGAQAIAAGAEAQTGNVTSIAPVAPTGR